MTAVLEHVCSLTTGSEHLEAVISTGLRYAVPHHGSSDRWDWGVTIRSIDFALQRHKMLVEWVKDMTPEQRAAAWELAGPEGERLRRLMR